MTRAKWLGLFLVGSVVLILIWVAAFLIPTLAAQRQLAATNSQRCHLFNVLISPGMTRSEVGEVLHGFGAYSVSDSEFPGGLSQMYVDYADASAGEAFGSELVFEFADGRFARAWIPTGVGESAPACSR